MERRRMTYEQTMAWGTEQYRDVLEALAIAGLRGEFIQTGGMCAAIEIVLDGGHYLLLTDRDDTLSWDRQAHEGWFCGLYEPEERRTADGPIRWLLDYDGSPGAAAALCARVLQGDSAE